MEQEVASVRFDVTIIHDPHMGVGSVNSLKQLLFGILRILGIIQGDVQIVKFHSLAFTAAPDYHNCGPGTGGVLR
jgi:hypothetical protein